MKLKPNETLAIVSRSCKRSAEIAAVESSFYHLAANICRSFGRPYASDFSSGRNPEKRCPSCAVLVHTSAFHIQEKLTSFYVGESVLGWDKANEAGNMVNSHLHAEKLRLIFQ